MTDRSHDPEVDRELDSVRIFVTVGTELPFDRLVTAVDAWAERSGVAHTVLAQIGHASCRPEFIRSRPFLEPNEFRKVFAEAELVVAHAGMGTILNSLTSGKTLLVMPRRADAGEHRSDHQLATAAHLQRLDRVNVALDEIELVELLDDRHTLTAKDTISPHASTSLLAVVRRFIDDI